MSVREPDVAVVEAKLRPPTQLPGAVGRPVLLDRLDSGTPGALRLVVAPAGWGKSQLLAQWLARRPEPAAYVAGDAADNDPERFWRHLLTSLGRTGVDVDSLFSPLRAPALPFGSAIVEPLAAQLRDQPITIAVEDVHTITSPEVLETLEHLVNIAPPSVTVMLVSRSDPPIRLPRRRLAGSVVEIRAADLRLTREQVGHVVEGASGHRLADGVVEALVARTEGWAAGVYLAGLSMRASPDPSAFVTGFAGDDRVIGDYLSSELLPQLSEDERSFLTRTAVLEGLEPDVCNELLSRTDAAAMIDRLVRTNLFVLPTDEHGRSYRYHHLFRDWLLLELDRSLPGEKRELHLRASAVFAGKDDPSAAIAHALLAGDYLLAHRLMGRAAIRFIDSGSVGTVARWLSAIPDEGDRDRALDLAAVRAWVGIIDGDLDTVHHQCRVATELIQAAGWESEVGLGLPGEFDVLRAYALLLEGDVGTAAATAAAARDKGVSQRTAVAMETVAESAGYWLGRPDLGALRAVSAASQVIGDPYGQVLAEAFLAHAALDQLDIDAAAPWVESVFAAITEAGIEEYGAVAIGHVARARCALLGGDAEGARRDAARAVDLAQRRGDRPVEAFARLIQAQAAHTLGDDAAVAHVSEAANLVETLADPGVLAERLVVGSRQLRLPANTPKPTRLDAPIEPLTDREMALLRLLPGTLSQRELGEAIHVSFNTVKTYNRQIYRKLGASGRDDAVATARSMGLL